MDAVPLVDGAKLGAMMGAPVGEEEGTTLGSRESVGDSDGV